jgi:hypothetical protein
LKLTLPADGGFFGKGVPVPFPLPPVPGGAAGGGMTVEVQSGTRTIVVPAQPGVAPDVAGQVQGLVPPTLSLWDFAAAKWRRMTVKDNAVQISGGDRARYISERQILARIKLGGPEQAFRMSSFTLEEVS